MISDERSKKCPHWTSSTLILPVDIKHKYGVFCLGKDRHFNKKTRKQIRESIGASALKTTALLSFFLNHKTDTLREESSFLLNKKKRTIDVEGRMFKRETGGYKQLRRSGDSIDFERIITYRSASPTRDLMMTNWIVNKKRYMSDNRSRLFPKGEKFDEKSKRYHLPWNYFGFHDSIFDAMIAFNTPDIREQLVKVLPLLRNGHIISLEKQIARNKDEEKKSTFVRKVKKIREKCPKEQDAKKIIIRRESMVDTYYNYPRCLLDYHPETLSLYDMIWFPSFERFPNWKSVKNLILGGSYDKLENVLHFENVERLSLGGILHDYSPLLKLKKLKRVVSHKGKDWITWDNNFEEVKEKLARKGVEAYMPRVS